MKRFFKIIGLWLILSAISLTANRCKHKCDDTPIEYSILSFSLTELGKEHLQWINEEIHPLECRTDFGVAVRFKSRYEKIVNYKPVNSFFIQSAYATSIDCPEVKYYLLDSIVSIRIFSDKDFGETHSAGTDIAEFFKIQYGIYGEEFDYWTLTPLESFYKSSTSLQNHSMFNCVIVPVAVEAGEYEFTFVVELSDERILTNSIKAVLK